MGALVNVPPNRWLLQFFQTFEAFGLHDDFLTFNDFLTDLPTPSTSSYSTVIRIALVDELVLSTEEVAPSGSC